MGSTCLALHCRDITFRADKCLLCLCQISSSMQSNACVYESNTARVDGGAIVVRVSSSPTQSASGTIPEILHLDYIHVPFPSVFRSLDCKTLDYVSS